ncbi:MAG: hypothetical protein JWR32_3651 [Mycobacterium sp.]|jgi:hypothetical protein|nr:hypothetical protein [Mycobacterium sp.]
MDSSAENPIRWNYVTDDQLSLEGVGPPPGNGEGRPPLQRPTDAEQLDHTTNRSQCNPDADEPEHVRGFYRNWVVCWPEVPQDIPSQLRRRQCAKRRLPVLENGSDGDMASPRWWR